MDRPRSPGLDPELLISLPINAALFGWGIYTLLKPGGPRGEELVVVYQTVVPLAMLAPGWIAIHSWLNHWALTKTQLFVRNAPFAAVVLLWAWIATLPT
jgi:hypothetical protein